MVWEPHDGPLPDAVGDDPFALPDVDEHWPEHAEPDGEPEPELEREGEGEWGGYDLYDSPGGDLPAQGGPPAVDVPLGADPDVGEQAYVVAQFPPPLVFDGLPEPVDGYPWADADLLSDTVVGAPPVADDVPTVAQVAGYAGSDATHWQTLAGDPDPATAALARFWGDLDR